MISHQSLPSALSVILCKNSCVGTMIEEPIQKDEPKPFQLTKKLYSACMNKTAVEQDGLTTIKGILKQLGGWPVLDGDKWSEGDFDWREATFNFRRVGYSDIDLDQGSLGLRRS